MIQTPFKVKTIGELLREKREAKGLSHRQVAEIIKIRPEYLEDLEKGKYSSFASEVYVKGFLKNYARYLGIDQEKALALYRRENTQNLSAKIADVQNINSKSLDLSITPERIIIAIVAIFTLFILYYLGTQVNTILKRPVLEITSPTIVSSGESQIFETNDATISFKGKISVDASLKLNGDNVATNNLAQFEIRDINLNLGENNFLFIAENQFGRKSELSVNIVRLDKLAQTEKEEDKTETSPIKQEMKITVTIINREANVKITNDGTIETNQVYQPGTKLEYVSKTSFALQTPRPDSVEVTIDNQKYTLYNTREITWRLVDGSIIQSN